jgi:hypothetical protein
METPFSKPPARVKLSSLGLDKDRTQNLLGKNVSTLACITNCWKRQMKGMQEKQLFLLGFLSVWILRRRIQNSITH